MKVRITDVHDSDGLILDLHFENPKWKRNRVFAFLKKQLTPFISGKFSNQSTLYVHGIKITPTDIVLRLVETSKHRACIDHGNHGAANSCVLIVEGESDEVKKVPGGTI